LTTTEFFGVYDVGFDKIRGHRIVKSIDAVVTLGIPGSTPPPTAAEQALQSFVASIQYGTFVENDDGIFRTLFYRDVSPQAQCSYHTISQVDRMILISL
jgi:hypothetical protein